MNYKLLQDKGVFIFILAIVIFFHALSSNIPDPDSFFRIRQAWMYQNTSLFNTTFPWTYFSVLRVFVTDLWYGFHLLLIPFSYLNLIWGIRIAGVILASALLMVFYRVGKRYEVELSEFWPFFFFLAVPNVIYHLLSVRPQTLSLIFSLLLLAFLNRGRWWQVSLASFGINFFHLSFFWIGPLITILVLCVELVGKLIDKTGNIQIQWQNIFYVLSGTIAGWVLRPGPIAAAQLAYIQIIKFFFEKEGGTPLTFGKEHFPLGFGELVSTSTLFLLIWSAAACLCVWIFLNQKQQAQKIPYSEKNLLLSSGLVSILFFLMTIFIAQRSLTQWVTFGSVFIALAYTYVLPQRFKNDIKIFLFIVLLIMFPYAIYRHGLNMKYVAFEPNEFIEVATWLKEHSEPGDIVFNVHWDNFPSLFLWNQKNYYIGGLDPIFQYAYDPSLYWKFYYLSRDALTDHTCGTYPCLRSALEDTYNVLVRDFNAKYIVAEDWRNPKLFRYFETDPRYEKVFVGPYEAVFKIKRAP
jgi:hypothetical protein